MVQIVPQQIPAQPATATQQPTPQQPMPQPATATQQPLPQQTVPPSATQVGQPQPPAAALPPSSAQSLSAGPQTGGFAAEPQQRTWESPWEKEQKSQQVQNPAHRSIPVTPPSVFEPPAEAVEATHHSELRLGELNLDQFSEEHNYDASPPTRADMHHMHGEYHPNAAIPEQPAAAKPASGRDVDDISDLLELAAKAPSKKS